MSDTTTLSHEYEASALFAEEVNRAVLSLKKLRVGRTIPLAEIKAARERLTKLLDAVATSMGASDRRGAGVTVPGEVLERLAAKHSNQLAYFQDDLVQTAKTLRSESKLEDDAIKVLDEICDAADATASASFRRLRRR